MHSGEKHNTESARRAHPVHTKRRAHYKPRREHTRYTEHTTEESTRRAGIAQWRKAHHTGALYREQEESILYTTQESTTEKSARRAGYTPREEHTIHQTTQSTIQKGSLHRAPHRTHRSPHREHTIHRHTGEQQRGEREESKRRRKSPSTHRCTEEAGSCGEK